MKHLIIDLALTFTIVPALLGCAFWINYNRNSIGYKLKPTELVESDKSKNNLSKIDQYIERFKETAILEQEKFGIPASISLAQGILESGCGKSELASDHNNHFGIKCFRKGCHKAHCTQYADDKPTDRFRNYSSAWQSWRDHSKFLSAGQYAKLKGLKYKEYAKGLKRIGYATKKSYASDLIAVIEDNNLQRFDK
jgi:flagellum-specific peptidoglycan hydrolase FlgJ